MLLLVLSKPLIIDSIFAQGINTKSELTSEKQKELTEVQKLKTEILKLKIQLAQAQVNNLDLQSKLTSIELTSEQSSLEAEFRVSLKPEKDSKFNWQTLKFENEKKDIPPIIK